MILETDRDSGLRGSCSQLEPNKDIAAKPVPKSKAHRSFGTNLMLWNVQ